MTDITAVVSLDSQTIVSFLEPETTTVSSIGIQGDSGSVGNIEDILNVSAASPVNGSLLIYNTGTSLWTASITLDSQDITGGQY